MDSSRNRRLDAVQRLKDDPDFRIYLEELNKIRQEMYKAARQVLTTAEKIANHNVVIGIIAGLDQAISLTDRIEMAEELKERMEAPHGISQADAAPKRPVRQPI